VGVALFEAMQANQIDHLLSGLLNLLLGPSSQFQRQADVLEESAPGHQVRLLEDQTSLRPGVAGVRKADFAS